MKNDQKKPTVSSPTSTALLCVGDILIVKTCLNESEFLITRVTKTLAKSKTERDGYEHTFKRFISCDMSHPNRRYNNVEYRVVRKDT